MNFEDKLEAAKDKIAAFDIGLEAASAVFGLACLESNFLKLVIANELREEGSFVGFQSNLVAHNDAVDIIVTNPKALNRGWKNLLTYTNRYKEAVRDILQQIDDHIVAHKQKYLLVEAMHLSINRSGYVVTDAGAVIVRAILTSKYPKNKFEDAAAKKANKLVGVIEEYEEQSISVPAKELQPLADLMNEYENNK